VATTAARATRRCRPRIGGAKGAGDRGPRRPQSRNTPMPRRTPPRSRFSALPPRKNALVRDSAACREAPPGTARRAGPSRGTLARLLIEGRHLRVRSPPLTMKAPELVAAHAPGGRRSGARCAPSCACGAVAAAQAGAPHHDHAAARLARSAAPAPGVAAAENSPRRLDSCAGSLSTAGRTKRSRHASSARTAAGDEHRSPR
jgi:hypothetical protein